MVEATLIKKRTDDGLMEVFENVEVGKKYLIDPSSEMMMRGFNIDKKVSWSRKMVKLEDGTWYPSELLDWPGKEKLS